MGVDILDQDQEKVWQNSILSTLSGAVSSDPDNVLKVKKLRKMVLVSLRCDESDKAAKKMFKKNVQALEHKKIVSLDAEGKIKLLSKKHALKRDEVETKKKKRKTKPDTENCMNDEVVEGEETTTEPSLENEKKTPQSDQHLPCKGNPQGVTRLFLGNLPFAVDEASLGTFLPGTVTHVKWITDKETGKFYGSAFVEMGSTPSAADAVALNGTSLMGRPVKINFAEARPGDVWPPVKSVVTGGTGQAGGSGIKAMSEKPDNCTKLFLGNCSFEITDDTIIKFFGAIDAEVKAVRWLHHKDTNDFKGCGFVEFWDTAACEKAAALNGKNLLGRPIRIDWTE